MQVNNNTNNLKRKATTPINGAVQKKQRKNTLRPKLAVVRRCFYEDRLNLPKGNNGTPRLTCIVYDEDRITGDIRFGASFYRREPGMPIEGKRSIKNYLRETAMGRLEKNPGKMNCKTTDMKYLHQMIRKQLYRTKFVHRENQMVQSRE